MLVKVFLSLITCYVTTKWTIFLQCLLSLNLESMSEYTTRDTQFSITGLAAAKAQNQFIASGSDDGVVKIWK